MIAAIALLVNAANVTVAVYGATDAKKSDSAVAWCKDFYLPTFVQFQADARKINTDTRFSISNDIADLKEGEAEKATVAIVCLLNYIDQGASLVKRNMMDREIFRECFTVFTKEYIRRLKNTNVGAALVGETGKTPEQMFADAVEVTK
jgi:hypothetical protein